MLLLLSAVIFNFSTLQRGAILEEGTQQTEALLRFARAYAAGTGRRVEIRFEEMLDENLATASRVQVRWEPEPLLRPGVFEPLREADTYLNGIQGLVRFESILPPGDAPWDRVGAGQGRGASTIGGGAAAAAATGPGAQPGPVTFRPDDAEASGVVTLHFYPDGSSDSLKVVLAALDEEETRRMEVLLQGDTGMLRRRILSQDDLGREESSSNTTSRAESKDSDPGLQPAEEEAAANR